jgi:hypothetical protein
MIKSKYKEEIIKDKKHYSSDNAGSFIKVLYGLGHYFNELNLATVVSEILSKTELNYFLQLLSMSFVEIE